MRKKILSLIVVVAASAIYIVKKCKCCNPPKPPHADLEQWWGPGVAKEKPDTSIRPFKVEFSEAMIKDLKQRLKQRRPVPPPLEGVGFQYGFNSDYLSTVIDFWQNSYNFKEREAFLNSFPQFKTYIQGLDIHYIHIKPKVNNKLAVVPLILMHGWPGSVREFYEAIPLLTTPSVGRDFVFEVIVPSLPGYGFSSAAVRPGLGACEVSIVMRNLMQRLGHKKYYVQGGDWGSLKIGSNMATMFPYEVLGYHSNVLISLSKCSTLKWILGAIYPPFVVEDKYVDRMYPLKDKIEFIIEETGYMHLQSTKPDTVGTSLSDSPAGLAAYILEKFSTWTNSGVRGEVDGKLTKMYNLVHLLDNIMIYWSSNSITTSMRLYSESSNKRQRDLRLDEMGKKILLALIVLAAAAAIYIVKNCKCCNPPKPPHADLEQWWGPGVVKAKPDTSIRPFKVEFSEAMIKDLKQRLKQRRPVPSPLEGVGFRYGFNSDYLSTVIDFWQNSYNFKEREAFLNSFPQFKTNIQGLDIHYIHIKPKVNNKLAVVPLILLHGWPGSVREFYEAIPLLTTPSIGRDFVFEVIVPSLPGYGFSSAAVRPGLGAFEVSIVMRNLMQRLGHKKYYVQGGDWGSLIGSNMATIFPNEVLGYHSNLLISLSKCSTLKLIFGAIYPPFVVEDKYVDRMYPLKDNLEFMIEEMGYMHLQSTKPDTVGTALSDSPAGLAAYILEKFSTWTNFGFRSEVDGKLTKNYSLVHLLDNIMIYWSSNSITTSMRLYSESFNKRQRDLQLDEISTPVPTWGLKTKYEVAYQPDSFLRGKYTNLLGSNVLDDGGHFAAFELPAIFADDVFNAVIKFREFHKQQSEKKTEL